MKNYFIARSRRVRSTPYTSRIENQGVNAYTVYNHMLLPAAFGSLEDSYHHLKEHVQVWDVAGERQVEISGKDYLNAERFAAKEGLTLLGIYHSHPVHPAIPSEHDLAVAMPWFSYIIVSVEPEGVDHVRSWQLTPERKFEEETIK